MTQETFLIRVEILIEDYFQNNNKPLKRLLISADTFHQAFDKECHYFNGLRVIFSDDLFEDEIVV
jgi:hypothetical protein